MYNLPFEIECDLQDNERARKYHFHLKVLYKDSFWDRGKSNLNMAYCLATSCFPSNYWCALACKMPDHISTCCVNEIAFFLPCRPIPNQNTGFSITFGNCTIKFLEHVQVKVNLDFTRRGDLSLQLKAPSGTISPLTRKRVIDNLTRYKNLTNWVITTLFNWGESPIGKWELSVRDFDPKIPSTGT